MEDKAKEFAKKFMEDNDYLFTDEDLFIDNNLLKNRIFNKNKDGIAYGIFINRVKILYNKLVMDGEMSEEDLSNSLKIIVKTDSLFTTDNVLSIHQAILAGFYDEELDNMQNDIKFEELDWGDDIWGS